ncbi:MAG: hypothetical protein HRT98_01590 [Mycoplasmatales bacterium]|nr:hypothetical protein [Mycoplasmatales bacterium]
MDNLQTNMGKVQLGLGRRFLAGLINALLGITIIVPILNLYFMFTKNWSIGTKLMGYEFQVKEDKKIMYILFATLSVAFFWPIMLIVQIVFLLSDSKLATEKFSDVKFVKTK